MPTYPYGEKRPKVDPTAYLAPGAWVIGDVELGPRASVWFNAVLRGDSDRVRVGASTNVQDGAVLHVDAGSPCTVGDECTIGHNATVHGCTIGDGCLIGMGAVVLSGAVIEDECIVAAGALVAQGRRYPRRSLLAGSPARRIREVTDEDVERLIRPGVLHYVEFGLAYRAIDLGEKG